MDRSNINLNAYATFGENVGTGTTVFAGKCDVGTLQFKTLSAVGGIVVLGDGQNVILSGDSAAVATWGSITGTISSQTDLQNALDEKLNVNTFTGYTATTESRLLVIESDITTLDNDVTYLSGQTDLRLLTEDFTGYTANTQVTLTDLRNDLNTVSGQTDLNTLDITTLSGKTIDNLESGILDYSVTNKTFQPYSAITEGVGFYSGTTCPTGITEVSFNGILAATELRVSTGTTHGTHNIGDIYWSEDDQAVSVQQSVNVSLQIGQENYIFVKNNTGVGINNGQVVYINGADGNRPTIKLARASSSDSGIVGSIIGIVTEDISNGETGFVTSFGLVKGLNITDPAGTALYVSTTTSGDTQTTKPSPPDHAIKIGVIAKTDGIDGRVLVSVTNETDLTGTTYTANNGLTKCGDNFVLGGSLTGDTEIDGNFNTLSISDLSNFNITGNTSTICASQNFIIDGGNSFNLKRGGSVTMIALASCKLLCDGDNSEGFVYGQNYSAVGGLNPRWIPDNAYVTGLTSQKIDCNDALSGYTCSNATAFGFNTLPYCATTYNTAVGSYVLTGNTTGTNNIGIGFCSIANNTTGISNVGIGNSALKCNLSGDSNIGIGISSLLNNFDGSYNVGIGGQTLVNNVSQSFNIAIGNLALRDSVSGNDGIAIGKSSMSLSTGGTGNIGVGAYTLNRNCTGVQNIAIGSCSMCNNETGSYNISMGLGSMDANVGGSQNIGIGPRALHNNQTGSNNLAIGYQALFCGTSAGSNIALGNNSLGYNQTGGNNIAIGSVAIRSNDTGNDNIGIGNSVLCGNSSGCGNIGIGVCGLFNKSTGCDNIAIGCDALFGQSSSAGNCNIAIGRCSQSCSDSGIHNISMGNFSLRCNLNGGYNIAFGPFSLYCASASTLNVAIGCNALRNTCNSDSNIAIGGNSQLCNISSNNNISIGRNSLTFNQSGLDNTSIGTCAGYFVEGGCNTMVGSKAMCGGYSASGSVAIGYRAGQNATGNTNVFIGNDAGFNESGDSKLHIANSSSCTLIYGEFDNKRVCSCGVFYPGSYNCVDASCSGLPAPSAHTGGMIYVSDAVLMVWSNGTDWLDIKDGNPI